MGIDRRRFLCGLVAASGYTPGEVVGSIAPEKNPVLIWNERFIDCVKKQSHAPGLVARNLAILHVGLLRVCRTFGQGEAEEGEIDGALNVVGKEICLAQFPSMRAEVEKTFSTGVALAGEREIAAARELAHAILAARSDDGATSTVHYVPKVAPGQWRRTPPQHRPPELPHWPKVRPFVIRTAGQFRPPPPPAIDSAKFLQALGKVRSVGGAGSSARDAEQTLIAKFWSDFSYTTSPPGHWNAIAREIAGRRLGVVKCAELFALLNVALADVGIAAWECKYHYNFWRPVTALQTTTHPGWLPLLTTPPHPEYVSGHSASSGAAAEVLGRVFGTPELDFNVRSDSVEGQVRAFRSVDACAAEVSESRVLGGIHYDFSCDRALELGRKVGAWCADHFDEEKLARP